MADIRLEHVYKSYGDNHVHEDLNLTIKDGECFTLLGPSGCVKTVMLRMIAGFELPDKGKIYIGENCVADGEAKLSVPPEERNLGVVFQDYAVWPHMTVAENIAYPLKVAGKSKEEVVANWAVSRTFAPGMDEAARAALLRGWEKAVGRSLHWAQ
jgi:iron(III) transport system ATP-binding protein